MPPLTTLLSRLAPRREFKHLNDHDDNHNHNFGHRNGSKKVAQTNFDSKHPTSKSASHQEKVLAQDLAKGNPEDDAGETSMTAIPVPIPDTGSHHSDSADTTKSHSKSSTTTSEHSKPTSSFVSTTSLLLPTTAVFSPTPPTATISSTFQSVSLIPTSGAHASSPAGPHLSTLAISLLASGAACVIVALFIIIKVCSRPRRRTPTPSLPILEEGFDDIYKPSVEDSPLFGGKERISHLDNGFSPWPKDLQAPQWPPEPVQAFNNGSNATSHWTQRREVDYVFSGHSHNQGSNYEPNIASPRPIRQMKDAITRVTRRLSATSLSGGNSSIEPTGLGIGDDPPFTADGYQVMERKSRLVSRKSINGSEILPQGRRRSQSLRQSMGLAYDGADVLSPCSHDIYVPSEIITPIAIAEPSPAHGGRSRIKSSYFTSYPRSSTAPMSTSASAFNHAEPSGASLQRSESRRDQDTKALAAALGLSSPSPICPPPPSPTIHPDDSLSVGGRRFSKMITSRSVDRAAGGDTRPRYSLSAASPRSPSSVLGNLMLLDFGASKSLANIGFSESTRQSYASSKLPTSMSKKSLYDDRPPRVPSPPPLPSLAQMGLEKSCPETFASYRSPTYSIFGLYEDSRRSVQR